MFVTQSEHGEVPEQIDSSWSCAQNSRRSSSLGARASGLPFSFPFCSVSSCVLWTEMAF